MKYLLLLASLFLYSCDRCWELTDKEGNVKTIVIGQVRYNISKKCDGFVCSKTFGYECTDYNCRNEYTNLSKIERVACEK